MEYLQYQGKKYQLTINNPIDFGLSHDRIKNILEEMASIDYFCLADEIGESGTFHTHVFLHSKNALRWSTIKRKFPSAHIEPARGSTKENRDYVLKIGKWKDSDKAETSIVGSFEEVGSIPDEGSERKALMTRIMDELRNGATTMSIINEYPNLGFRGNDIDALRMQILKERYEEELREVTVIYLFGETGTGKTRSIFEKHDPKNICRITNYPKGRVMFDSYKGQDVIVFEEFASQISIEEMLSYLDIYPMMLPARYSDKVMCATQIYITSNLPLEEQYIDIQLNKPKVWNAFLRRINRIVEFREDGERRIIK